MTITPVEYKVNAFFRLILNENESREESYWLQQQNYKFLLLIDEHKIFRCLSFRINNDPNGYFEGVTQDYSMAKG